ncbi:Bacterial regulatory protein, LuxR family [Labrenzia sp. THAF82]|uniref:helix-turn-helix transcriptional regulator n=1 Tax=Labrenzia sp. THAF82 TaxID=2587861 RepID=UPI0012A8A3AE|nr:LuxR C-terminal-related transcriptional regulator [Labrenzia sp. THAF82]QFT31435.1 Bacterial regulatory protein, LuxR family [Labrenzia sp. THAF82]
MPPFSSWKTAWPWMLFGLQSLCVVYLVIEEAADFLWGEMPGGLIENDLLENLVIAALVAGLVASGFEIRKAMTRQKRLEQQIKAASGAFANLMEEHFETWGLTPSECDVALFALKGFSIAEIASMRKTAEGTVKAQCNAIYRKAGVSGRPQLLSLFIDELLHGALVPEKASA